MTESKSTTKGSFGSTFGFIMASVGSAVGLGNIWGFPYKAGANGGFAFLIVYLVLALLVGYPLMLSEASLGRKTRKAAIEAHRECNPKFTINGFFECAVPFFMLCFYIVLGGIVMRYMVANFGDIFHAGFGVGDTDSETFFGNFISHTGASEIYMLLFLFLTSFIVARGIKNGIERFNNIAMPLLFFMLVAIVIRCCTLDGAGAGLAFLFKPDFSVFRGTGWIRVIAVAGSQMFFSLSLASGAIIAYGSYMRKEDNIEKSCIIIPAMDTVAALLAGMAVLPAVFAAGLEPSGGPGLLFVSLQTVFDSMGSLGPFFGFFFYLLVFLAALSSSIAMMEGGNSALIDALERRGHKNARLQGTLIITVTTFIGASLVALDQLGGSGMWKPFGLGSWLDVFDMVSEGILMPLGGLLMAIMLGWTRYGWLDSEIELSSPYRTKGFVNTCMKWIVPVFMAFIVFVQVSSFFFSGTDWYKALIG